jgi:hypothetical protein
MVRIVCCLCAVVAAFAGAARASEDVKVVNGMLRIAGVGKDDVVYELGYGDGSIVVEAARRFGCSGAGIYCDGRRIAESTSYAQAAGVAGQVSFKEQDLFTASIADASVVAIYLLPKDGIRLRPKLFAELRPGARCVSRDFPLGTWRPDGRSIVEGSNVYYWVIPANVSGVWKWRGTGNQRYSLKIGQVFQEASGDITAWPLRGKVRSMRVRGDNFLLTLETEYAARQRTVNFEGRVSGDIIEGFGEEDGVRFPWKAQRVAGSEQPIEPGLE